MARTDANVLLYGETGVGKDLLATTIHRNSHRQTFPYVKVGCTLFPPQLIESELYGHEKGSFTGADQHARAASIWPREERSISTTSTTSPWNNNRSCCGRSRRRSSNASAAPRSSRPTCGSSLPPSGTSWKRSVEGTFREDLYYRLDVLRINIPPLRERREDVPLLAEHLLRRIAGQRPCEIAPEAMELLARHDWPGNVRELYHTLERAYLIGGGRITADILATEIGGPDANQRLPLGGFQAAIDHAEKQLLQEALRNSGGNKSAAAAALGMKASTFRDKLAKHGLG